MQIRQFIREYSKTIQNGSAAVFAGAGLSVPSGYVSWKELLRPFAEELELSIDHETDYTAIMQYYYNYRGRNQSAVNNKIIESFSKQAKENESLTQITRLPIDCYWTTNYDHLIEEALVTNGRKPDVKITNENLSEIKRDCSAIVYKMHGDVQFPENIILKKQDYETYHLHREPFTTILKGDLLSRTFLFIGFSFEDPNLNSTLSWIKNLLGDNVREHYCFFEKVVDSNQCVKQRLITEDLKRYGIQTILLDSYSQIPSILKEIERQINLNNIFISSSMSTNNEIWSVEEAKMFASGIASGFVTEGLQITSGYGLGIGSAIITGVLSEVKKMRQAHFDDYLHLYPFPQPTLSEDYSKLWEKYRYNIMDKCGVAVFMFGNKLEDGKKEIANGMISEFNIAKEKGMVLIPFAATGDAATQIYSIMQAKKDEYPYLEGFWDILEQERDCHKLISVTKKIIEKVKEIKIIS